MQNQLDKALANKARRQKRQSKKAGQQADGDDAMSPDGDAPTPAAGKQQGTQRKCANCGMVGHIKTNKKSVTEAKCKNCSKPLDRVLGSNFTGGVIADADWS